MSGGIPWITLPAGYLGSSLIGAALIVCGFDTNASKVASLVMAAFFLFTLWWAWKSWVYVHRFHRSRKSTSLTRKRCRAQNMAAYPGDVRPYRSVLVRRRRSRVAVLRKFQLDARYHKYVLTVHEQVLFIGVMSDMYVLWDVVGACLSFVS